MRVSVVPGKCLLFRMDWVVFTREVFAAGRLVRDCRIELYAEIYGLVYAIHSIFYIVVRIAQNDAIGLACLES